MSVFAHKNFLVHVNRVEEEGTVQTLSGTLPVFIGDILLVDEYGNTTVTNEKWFNDNYLEVEKVQPKPRKRKMSPFEVEEFEKSLVDYAGLGSQLEDQDYIDGQSKLIANKPF